LGGDPFDQAGEVVQRIEMLTQAVNQGIITQNEANAFSLVNEIMDDFTQVNSFIQYKSSGDKGDVLPQILDALVSAGKISIEQRTAFHGTHEMLLDAGIMR
jgi:hypothetical protein